MKVVSCANKQCRAYFTSNDDSFWKPEDWGCIGKGSYICIMYIYCPKHYPDELAKHREYKKNNPGNNGCGATTASGARTALGVPRSTGLEESK